MPNAERLVLNGQKGLSGLVKVDAFPEQFAWFEMRDVLAWQCDCFTRLGISSHAWRTVVQGKTAESAYFDTVTICQRRAHLFNDGFDGQLDIQMCQVPLCFRQLVDEFRFGHSDSRFLFSGLAPLDKKLVDK